MGYGDKKATPKDRFPMRDGLALRVRRVVLIAANLPQVSVEGGLAVGKVLLCLEGCLIGRDGAQVLTAGFNRCANGREASACAHLVLRYRSGAFGFLTQVQAVTVAGLGGCYAVCTE